MERTARGSRRPPPPSSPSRASGSPASPRRPALSAGSARWAPGGPQHRGRCRRARWTDVRLAVFAGDHGVAAHGVSAYPSAVTEAMVRTIVAERAGVSALAREHGVVVSVYDVAVDADLADLPAAVTARKVRRSSGAIHLEDALTRRDRAGRRARCGHRLAGSWATGAQLLMTGRPRHRQHHAGRCARRRVARAARRRGHRSRHRHRRRGLDPQARRGRGCAGARGGRSATRSTCSRRSAAPTSPRPSASSWRPPGRGTPVVLDGLMSVRLRGGRQGLSRPAPAPGGSPGTARPSPPRRTRSSHSASNRSSTSGCGSARAPERSSRCRSSARGIAVVARRGAAVGHHARVR